MKYDANDRKQVKEARAVKDLKDMNEVEDLKKILSLPEGRRLIWRYLEFCQLNQAEFLPSGSATYYRDGMRNVGIKIQSEIIATLPDMFIQMMIEHNQEQS